MLPSFIARMSRPLTDDEKLARAEWERKRTELEARQEERRLEGMLASLGVKATTAKAVSSGRLDRTAALQGVEDQERFGRTFLLLSGGVGTGKTVAAASAAIAATKSGQRARFVKAGELSTQSSFGDAAEARMAELRRADVLVIDDLGLERLHDMWKQAFEDLIDHRWEEDLRTIITTNLPPTADAGRQSIRGVYGERVASRIRQKGLIVLCGTDDLRRTEAP